MVSELISRSPWGGDSLMSRVYSLRGVIIKDCGLTGYLTQNTIIFICQSIFKDALRKITIII